MSPPSKTTAESITESFAASGFVCSEDVATSGEQMNPDAAKLSVTDSAVVVKGGGIGAEYIRRRASDSQR